MDYIYLAIFCAVGAAMAVGPLLVSHFMAPRNPSERKATPYECGEPVIGPAWVQFNIGYYLFVLMFLVFDVETVFLFPCAIVMRELGVLALTEVGIFVCILGLGLVYAWRKGVLEWT